MCPDSVEFAEFKFRKTLTLTLPGGARAGDVVGSARFTDPAGAAGREDRQCLRGFTRGDCEHLWMHARHRHGDVSVTERGGRRHDGWTEAGQLIQRMSGVCESTQWVQWA